MDNNEDFATKKEDLTLRRMFVEVIIKENYLDATKLTPKENSIIFHDALHLAYKRGWLEPDALAKELDVPEWSMKAWFNQVTEGSFPLDQGIMENALRVVCKIMTKDIESLQSNL